MLAPAVTGPSAATQAIGLASLNAEVRREVVLTLTAEYPVRLICRATGLPRTSTNHEAAPAPDKGRLQRALGRRAARWPTYGYRQQTAMFRREDRSPSMASVSDA